MLDVTPYLSHKARLHKTTLSVFGDRTLATTPTTVACFAYYGAIDRRHNAQAFESDWGWTILFGTDCDTLVQIGDVVVAVKDTNGGTVIETATIDAKYPHHHWGDGLQAVLCRLKLG
jgi:hypothetical protein